MPSDKPARAPLAGCTVLPPLAPASPPQGRKGKTGKVAAAFAGHKKGGRSPGRGDRFAVLNAFADFALAGLSGAEVKVWLLLYRDTKADTGTARTGQADLARRAGVSVRTVGRAVHELERKGLVVVVRRGRLRTGPTVYRVQARPP
jgi:hypothetical protein